MLCNAELSISACFAWTPRSERDRDLLGSDEPIHAVARHQLDIDVMRILRQGEAIGATSVCRVAKFQPAYDVLSAEAVQLKIHDLLKAEGDQGLFGEDETAVRADVACIDPAMKFKLACAGPIEGKADDFRIVKSRLLTEPCE